MSKPSTNGSNNFAFTVEYDDYVDGYVIVVADYGPVNHLVITPMQQTGELWVARFDINRKGQLAFTVGSLRDDPRMRAAGDDIPTRCRVLTELLNAQYATALAAHAAKA